MTASWKIKAILKKRGKKIADLADAIGTSRQNLYNKFARDNLSESEIALIADALGCTAEVMFLDQTDGQKF